MKEQLKNILFRIWYWYISKVDKKAEVIFMNYGYSKNNQKLPLSPKNIKNRYSIQLYHYIASTVNLQNQDILEVGCGRGGGLSYINSNLHPHNSTGIDLNQKAIDFCQQNYTDKNINFYQGNAQQLNFQDNTFHTVLNVESSHRYNQMTQFLSEVYRVLKPGGHFLFTDFRHKDDIPKLNQQLKDTKFTLLSQETITSNVLEALKLSTTDRTELIKKLTPTYLHSLAKNFAATEGTPTYNKFATGEFEYLFYVLQR